MKWTIYLLISWGLLTFCQLCKSEDFNSHCWIKDRVYFCGENKPEIKVITETKIIEAKKEEDIIIKTYWEKYYSDKEICDAIYIIEGGKKTNYPYGIKSVKCNREKECRQICLNTIKNNRTRFKNQNKENDFLIFLAKRYCPDDWKIWLKNLKYSLSKEK